MTDDDDDQSLTNFDSEREVSISVHVRVFRRRGDAVCTCRSIAGLRTGIGCQQPKTHFSLRSKIS